MARQIASAAINEARNSHYEYTGAADERSLLLEGAGTNLCLQSEDFGTTWSTIGPPSRTAGAIPASVMGVALDLIGDTDVAVGQLYMQTIAFTGDGTKAISIFMKKGPTPPTSGSRFYLLDTTAVATRAQGVVTWDAAGVPTVAVSVGTLQETPREIANGIYRIQLIAPGVVAANTNSLRVLPASITAETGDVYAGGVQAENNPFCTSYIKTTTATVTRAADSLSFPFTLPPQEMTVYVKFIERGTASLAASASTLLQIGANSAVAPRVLIYNRVSGRYTAYHHNGSVSVLVDQAAGPAIGDLVEHRVVLGANGSVTFGQSINGAAETVPATSGAAPFAAAWAGSSLHPNWSGATAVGFTAFLAIKVARGTKTLAEMRAL